MPTNDERREVAANLREQETWDIYTDFEYCIGDLCDAVFDKSGDLNYMFRLQAALADLIEPEERTCRNVTDDPKANYFKCDACDCEVTDYDDFRVWIVGRWNYCPNCGAKVVEE